MTTKRLTPEQKEANKKKRREQQIPTEKQRLFAELVASGECKNLTEAHKQVYAGGISIHNRRKEASRVWNKPVVQAAAREIRTRISAQRALRLTGDADAIRRKLWNEAETADRAADRIAALKLLGQQRGVNLFADRIEISEPDATSDAEVIVEIEQILQSAILPIDKVPGERLELPGDEDKIH